MTTTTAIPATNLISSISVDPENNFRNPKSSSSLGSNELSPFSAIPDVLLREILSYVGDPRVGLVRKQWQNHIDIYYKQLLDSPSVIYFNRVFDPIPNNANALIT